jgi:hypothetical protein
MLICSLSNGILVEIGLSHEIVNQDFLFAEAFGEVTSPVFGGLVILECYTRD